MTRLTDKDVKEISNTLDALDAELKEKTGLDLFQIACDAVGLTPELTLLNDFNVGVVPVTSGEGVITRFSESVADICRHLGAEAFVTKLPDVGGFREAIENFGNMVVMADDWDYIAYNVKSFKASNNSWCTAAGYISALGAAIDNVIGKEVLVVGAGRVGTWATKLLVAKSAKVTVCDIDSDKARKLAETNFGVQWIENVEEAIPKFKYIINASPGHIASDLIQDGAVISSPGVPHTFDEAAFKKATIIHDPLAIGTAVMVVQAASFMPPDMKRCRK